MGHTSSRCFKKTYSFIFNLRPIKKSKLESKSANQSNLVSSNQHLDAEKFMSIFDLMEYRSDCKLVIGFNLTTKSTFIVLKYPIQEEADKTSKSSKKDDDQQVLFYSSNSTSDLVLMEKFQTEIKESFERTAHLELNAFTRTLNRIETFRSRNRSISTSFRTCNAAITHFSDLVNLYGSDLKMAWQSQLKFCEELKLANLSNKPTNPKYKYVFSGR